MVTSLMNSEVIHIMTKLHRFSDNCATRDSDSQMACLTMINVARHCPVATRCERVISEVVSDSSHTE